MGPFWIRTGTLAFLALGTALGAAAQVECLECHEGGPDPAAFADSVHGFLDCVDCHSGAEELPHAEPPQRGDCALCHEETVEEYVSSAHGQARGNGIDEAPWCAACHGEVHRLVPSADPASPVSPVSLPETCGACHSDPEVVEKFGIPVALPIEAYPESVHAGLCELGVEGATCSSCHGSHAIFAASDHRSKINHQRVPETCGQCHQEIAEAYDASVHGRAAGHGAREAPVCTDCHGEHRILSPREHGSPVFATNIPKMTCGRCHGDLRLAEKYGIETSAVPAYEDSYHGLASRAGTATVAHCASCHGVHDIQPSSDPRSHIHPDNLAATCGGCHPGAGQTFAIGSVHVLPSEPHHPAVYWVRLTYLWVIYLAVGGMVLHNLLDFQRKARSPQLVRAGPEIQGRRRMGLGFRIAHWLLLSSFATLVYTGFALTYPESWWAAPLLGWEESLGLRGWLHRGAALVLLFALAFHFVHLIVDRRARACIARMRPGRADWGELKERVRYFFGRRPDAPGGHDLGYPEKIEYLALMWGMAVMAVTGFVLWFENLALRWLPKWIGDVATVVHFYEAVLATLAIIVWHLYFVIFDPVVYPMDATWLTGREHSGRCRERCADTGSPDTGGRASDRAGRAMPSRP